ncbi:hypothetical protein KTC96_15695 [Clostridium estertheticum]|uniref:DUF6465 family protein n=1 Tax=Clostridium estertheticum TaxID=238834 RepID=UPI001C0E22A2|nr:DUF6465 family protein [Clostridium estertheticum]MBU3073456.1 hypothetical protein [Clostridium estertheticum]MBU3163303.1 hypothetical protein [Clostridium estertheticum]MBX4259338.1 hypothetical protein [Clostridium estertheticum]MCB2360223.1 DUF6465 family protein [Clostridium estertheticum]WLC69400.1 hypothetical protein KTC96_15695 [Clostridium estertheticum]
MEKDNTLTSDKKATSEGTEEAITIVSDVTKENVEKTINGVKDVAKNVKSKAKKVTTAVKKTAAKRTISKKIDVGFYVQYQGKEISKGTILEEVYKEWTKSHKITELKTLDVYIKVEEDIAYCLVNGEIKINIKLS